MPRLKGRLYIRHYDDDLHAELRYYGRDAKNITGEGPVPV